MLQGNERRSAQSAVMGLLGDAVARHAPDWDGRRKGLPGRRKDYRMADRCSLGARRMGRRLGRLHGHGFLVYLLFEA